MITAHFIASKINYTQPFKFASQQVFSRRIQPWITLFTAKSHAALRACKTIASGCCNGVVILKAWCGLWDRCARLLAHCSTSPYQKCEGATYPAVHRSAGTHAVPSILPLARRSNHIPLPICAVLYFMCHLSSLAYRLLSGAALVAGVPTTLPGHSLACEVRHA